MSSDIVIEKFVVKTFESGEKVLCLQRFRRNFSTTYSGIRENKPTLESEGYITKEGLLCYDRDLARLPESYEEEAVRNLLFSFKLRNTVISEVEVDL